jgi:hypothetical protein
MSLYALPPPHLGGEAARVFPCHENEQALGC